MASRGGRGRKTTKYALVLISLYPSSLTFCAQSFIILLPGPITRYSFNLRVQLVPSQPRNRDGTCSRHTSPSSQDQQVYFKFKFQSSGRLVFSCRILLPAHLHRIL